MYIKNPFVKISWTACFRSTGIKLTHRHMAQVFQRRCFPGVGVGCVEAVEGGGFGGRDEAALWRPPSLLRRSGC